LMMDLGHWASRQQNWNKDLPIMGYSITASTHAIN
jgi:hypothetical protein